MAGFLHKLLRHQQVPPQSSDEDTGIEKFYTNSEYELQVFEQLITAAPLPKRLLVIHGLGGVGKSTLLKMYVLACHKHQISVAFVASEEAPSPVNVLADWASDLSHDGITLPAFQKTLTHYRAIQTKVEDESKKGHQAKSEIAGALSKTVAKTAISMAASAIPIVGPLVGALGGESAEAFIDWLRSFLSKPDMELYLDPTKRMDADILSDLAYIATQHRIVLMIDTYEQMTALDNWMREFARRLSKHILLVIAGRTVPAWDRTWQEWMGKAEILELKEMTADDIRILVHRYYGYVRTGEPDPKQVEAIVQFARGLPMVATAVVQLWVKYGVEDFQTVRPQVVADLVDRLLEGVPQEVRPAFEVAAVLRYFNVEALRALLDDGNPEDLYAELRRWPFIRSRREGLAVHDSMREMINEALRLRTPERFRMLHERAANYHETQIQRTTGEERDLYALERLYHSIRAEERNGVQLFQKPAEDLWQYHLVNRLRALLNDVNNYPLERENSLLWRTYYNAHLAYLEGKRRHAHEIYQAIAENEKTEPKLRAYALCDWGRMLRRKKPLRGMGEKAIQVLEASLDLGVAMDVKLARSLLYLSYIYANKANWNKALMYLEHAKPFFSESNDYLGMLDVHGYERLVYWRQGNLQKTFDVEKEMWKTYAAAGEPAYLRNWIPPTWAWAWAGRYAEAEQEMRKVIEIAKSSEDQEYMMRRNRELVLYLSLQGKCSEALAIAAESLALARSLGTGSEFEVFAALMMYGIMCLKCGKVDKAEDYLTEAITEAQKLNVNDEAALFYLATLYEVLGSLDKAEHCYQLLLMDSQRLGRNLFVCGALTGLTHVKQRQNDYANISLLWTNAEQVAQQYEYNDYLASLYLTRGYIKWHSLIPEWGSDFDTVLHHFQLALIHALRFNRFLLDEALSGREQGSALDPLIAHCLERGEEGQKMLIALREWWQSANNAIGTPRPNTISPIPEGIPLLEAEHIARELEPGDGSPQKDVEEQIDVALKVANGREKPFP